MRIPDVVKKCVCFLCVEHNGSYKYGGTAFFIGLRSRDNPELLWTYLVTAKHSVDRARENYGAVSGRFNFTDGTAHIVPLPDRWVHSEAADVSVLPFEAPYEPDQPADYRYITWPTLATDDCPSK